jgi:hypothetical protein
MNIKVENDTEIITFKYYTKDSKWYVYVNGDIVQYESILGYRTFNHCAKVLA